MGVVTPIALIAQEGSTLVGMIWEVLTISSWPVRTIQLPSSNRIQGHDVQRIQVVTLAVETEEAQLARPIEKANVEVGECKLLKYNRTIKDTRRRCSCKLLLNEVFNELRVHCRLQEFA
jgi:hypothetical protein